MMTIEQTIFNAVKGLVADRVSPDVDENNAVFPYITYQQVGGRVINFVGADVPDKKRSRFQINVWAKTREEVALIAGQVEDALRVVPACVSVDTAPVATYEADIDVRGSGQDFSFML